jgi:hypothetical protein
VTIVIRKRRNSGESTHPFLVRAGHAKLQKGETVTWRNDIPDADAKNGVQVDLTYDPNAANIFEPGTDQMDITFGNTASRQVRADAVGGSGGQYHVFVRTASGTIQATRRAHGDSEPEVEVKG